MKLKTHFRTCLTLVEVLVMIGMVVALVVMLLPTFIVDEIRYNAGKAISDSK